MSKHFIVMFVFIVLASMGCTAQSENGQSKTQPTEGSTFAIYASDTQPPMYERGSEWEEFYKHGKLGKLMYDDKDIEAYDWDNQAIILNEHASKPLNIEAGWTPFIVVLDDKRLFGGKVLNRISQMAVEQPVVYVKTAQIPVRWNLVENAAKQ